MLVKLMEGVEDIPEVVLTEGLPWNWRSFPDFLDALDARPYDMDVATQVPHAALRVLRHGRARRRSGTCDGAGSPRDGAARSGRDPAPGALGFSTSRTLNHKTLDGEPIPTLNAAEAELAAIAGATARAGAGWLQVISDFDESETEFAMLRRLVAHPAGRWRSRCCSATPSRRNGVGLPAGSPRRMPPGCRCSARCSTRPTGIMLGFEISQNPFVDRPSYQRDRASAVRAADRARCASRNFRARLLGRDAATASAHGASRARNGTACSRSAIRRTTSHRPSALRRAQRGRVAIRPKSPMICCWSDGRQGDPVSAVVQLRYGNLDTVHDMLAHDANTLSVSAMAARMSACCAMPVRSATC